MNNMAWSKAVVSVFTALFLLFSVSAFGQDFYTLDDGSVSPFPVVVTQSPQGPEYFYPALYPSDSTKASNVLLDLSHNPVFGSTFASKFSAMISYLQSNGFNVTIASDFANIMNYDVVIETLPQSSFSASDVTALINYLDAGKILHIWGEFDPWWPSPSAVTNLLTSLNAGVQVEPPVVAEPTNNINNNIIQIVVYDFTNHCLNDNVSGFVFPATGYVSVNNTSQVLYYTSSQSYLRDNSSVHGPFPVAAIADTTTHPNWKLVVMCDSSQFSTGSQNYFGMFDNDQAAYNLMTWCQEGCTSNADCDDGVYCNGAETCNLTDGTCNPGTDPCGDDGLYCNGTEGCDEGSSSCTHTGDPCSDDGFFCNGTESCNESTDTCDSSGDPCGDDGEFCNGDESCNEDTDACDHSGNPCPEDDGLFCNGTETVDCNEDIDECGHTGNPCSGIFEECNEDTDECEDIGGEDDDDDDDTAGDDDDDDTASDDDDDDSSLNDDDDDDDDNDTSAEDLPGIGAEEEDEDSGCCGC